MGFVHRSGVVWQGSETGCGRFGREVSGEIEESVAEWAPSVVLGGICGEEGVYVWCVLGHARERDRPSMRQAAVAARPSL